MDKVRINEQIAASEVRLIGSQGENLGILSREAALAQAQEAGLDLIEIAPNAKPPVVRLIAFDKYRYAQEKASKKERRRQKGGSLKQVQVSVRAAKNDLLVKAKKLDQFLNDNHQVEIRLRLRGREKAHRDWAKQKLEEFLTLITVEYRVIGELRVSPNGLSIALFKK